MIKYVLPAAILSLMMASPAAALTTAPPAKQVERGALSSVIDIRDHRRDHRKWRKYRRHKHKHRYRAGSRHRHAPRGWHRYNHRPGDWHTRGCIIVGPVWFCP